jgi:hypothetical protein
MNERIKQLLAQAHLDADNIKDTNWIANRFAELIVKECMTISKTWEDELEKSKMHSESDAVGIVRYRISRQFGVSE